MRKSAYAYIGIATFIIGFIVRLLANDPCPDGSLIGVKPFLKALEGKEITHRELIVTRPYLTDVISKAEMRDLLGKYVPGIADRYGVELNYDEWRWKSNKGEREVHVEPRSCTDSAEVTLSAVERFVEKP